MRRGQAAAEYVVLIAIILILLAVVLRILIATPTADTYGLQVAQDYWKATDIGLQAWAANGTHIALQVVNNLPRAIEIQDITINNTLSFTNDFTLEPGDSKRIIGNYSWNVSSYGEEYTAEVWFTYMDTATTDTYQFYGQSRIMGTLTPTIIS